ncbi:MAG TPA: tRNA cyclic N6-threonylcarbamoyladenosine(37) synthase TcdA [Janthinobacterium sp.]|nr:tRNA cyclic N6-threonylcarbamoyladenosine(37) synthase TcdA [Janthinobacterium sp.]
MHTIINDISPPPAGGADTDTDIDFARRFGGIGRLYGARALERFRAAHVCVIGVGGVGSWVVEALARSAVGQLTLIDLDNVAESNINRQIQALSATIGQAKIAALAERIAQINPFCRVNQIEDFITPDNLPQMIGGHGYDYVIDAIDSARSKAALVAYCRVHGIPLLLIGSAGGQTDPTQIAVRDLSKTEQEPLLKKVRKLLRTEHGFPRGVKNKFNVDAVFSMEPLQFPGAEEVCAIDAEPRDGVTGLNCAGFGSTTVVTASFGMVAAAHALRHLAAGPGQLEQAPSGEQGKQAGKAGQISGQISGQGKQGD